MNVAGREHTRTSSDVNAVISGRSVMERGTVCKRNSLASSMELRS